MEKVTLQNSKAKRPKTFSPLLSQRSVNTLFLRKQSLHSAALFLIFRKSRGSLITLQGRKTQHEISESRDESAPHRREEPKPTHPPPFFSGSLFPFFWPACFATSRRIIKFRPSLPLELKQRTGGWAWRGVALFGN